MSISLFVSDLHASLNLPFAHVSPDLTTSDRLEDVLAVLDHVREHAVDVSAERVFILGDLFNDRHPDAPTLVRVARALKELTRVVEVHLLPGNHDAHDRAGKVYSLGMFAELQVDDLHVSVASEPWLFDGILFYMIPWLPAHRFNAALVEVNAAIEAGRGDDRPRVLLIHQDIPGATEGSYTATKGADTGLFEPWDLVLSGHIHKPQVFKGGRYLGAPLHLRFTDADDHQPRGFWQLDHKLLIDDLAPIESKALTLIETNAPRFVRWRFIEDDDVTPDQLAADLVPELVEELPDVPVYLEAIIEGEREDVDAARKIIRHAVDSYEGEVRFFRMSAIITNDGASERVRKAVTEPGKLATPLELARAYAQAAEPTLPDGLTVEGLMLFAEGVLR